MRKLGEVRKWIRAELSNQKRFTTKCYISYEEFMNKPIKTITQRELHSNSSVILQEVQAGETIIVTHHGVPVAELGPVHRRHFVPRAAIAQEAIRASRIDVLGFHADIDAIIDQVIHD